MYVVPCAYKKFPQSRSSSWFCIPDSHIGSRRCCFFIPDCLMLSCGAVCLQEISAEWQQLLVLHSRQPHSSTTQQTFAYQSQVHAM